MDIKNLTYFKTIAEKGSFSLAAKTLHISQPSLSNAIKNLENRLESKLFERTTREIFLTEAGEILLEKTKNILLEVEKTHKEMNEVKLIGKGTLIIGMVESAKRWIPMIIKEFTKKHPNINIKLKELSPDEIKVDLDKYKIHVGITSSKIDDPLFTNSLIFNDKLVLSTFASHKFANESSLNIKQLNNEILIHSLSGYYIRERMINECKKAGFEPIIRFETESLEAGQQLVRIGLGSAIVPESFIKNNYNDGIKKIYFDDDSLNRDIYVAYIKNRHLPPAIYDFINIMEKAFVD